MLGCRRRVESGGHDVHDWVRCYGMERCRSSLLVDASAVVRSWAAHHHPQASLTVRRSRRRKDPHFPLQIHPAKCRTKTLKKLVTKDPFDKKL